MRLTDAERQSNYRAKHKARLSKEAKAKRRANGMDISVLRNDDGTYKSCDFTTLFEKNFTKTRGCWEWQSTFTGARPTFSLNGKKHNVSKVAYLQYIGDVPSKMYVCHSCDNPKCCNPDHLFLGTAKDNSEDMVSKGRSAKGSCNGNAKLTESDVRRIRALKEGGMKIVKLVDIFNVSRVTIRSIITFKTWKHLEVVA